MSTLSQPLYHPFNGTPEDTWVGPNWPALLFGVIWCGVKGLWGQFFISLVICIVTAGFAAPLVWIFYFAAGNDLHRSSLIKKGYLTKERWDERNTSAAPAHAAKEAPATRDHLGELAKLGELRAKGVLTEEEFSAQKAILLQKAAT
jgi:hypothetical protein